MPFRTHLAFVAALATSALALSAQSLAPIRAKCTIGISENGSEFSLRVNDTDCPE